MVEILVTLLIAVLVVGILYWITTMLPIPAPFKQIAMVVCALILLIWLLNMVGLVGEPWRVRFR